MGCRFCDAYEAYLYLHQPQLSFEWAWICSVRWYAPMNSSWPGVRCATAPYVRDAYALDYERCPFAK